VTLAELNALPRDAAVEALLGCCGSRVWAAAMAAARPFEDMDAVRRRADEIWRSLARGDWLDAFRAHPRIGESTTGLPAAEQAGAASAAGAVRRDLRDLNVAYEGRFGHIFIICASGKSGAAMRDALASRLENPPDVELRIAAEEQRQITRLRLERLVGR
jgi:OHCU decarboxylase